MVRISSFLWAAGKCLRWVTVPLDLFTGSRILVLAARLTEEEVYLCNTQHTIYRHAYNMCNIRIAIN